MPRLINNILFLVMISISSACVGKEISKNALKYEYFTEEAACGKAENSEIKKLIGDGFSTEAFEVYGNKFQTENYNRYKLLGFFEASKIAVVLTSSTYENYGFILIDSKGNRLDYIAFPWPSKSGDRFVYAINDAENSNDNGVYSFSYSLEKGFGERRQIFNGERPCNVRWVDENGISLVLQGGGSGNDRLIDYYKLQ